MLVWKHHIRRDTSSAGAIRRLPAYCAGSACGSVSERRGTDSMPSTGEEKRRLNKRQNRIRCARTEVQRAAKVLLAAHRELQSQPPILAHVVRCSSESQGSGADDASSTSADMSGPVDAEQSLSTFAVGQPATSGDMLYSEADAYRLLLEALESESMDTTLQGSAAAWSGMEAVLAPIHASPAPAGTSALAPADTPLQPTTSSQNDATDLRLMDPEAAAARIDLSSKPRSWESGSESESSGEDENEDPLCSISSNVRQLLHMLEAVQPSDVPAVDASPALAPKRAAGLPRPVLEMLLRRCRTWLQEEEESARHRTLPGMSSDKQPADAVVAPPSDVFIQSRTVGSMPSERSASSSVFRALECMWVPIPWLKLSSQRR